MTDSGGFKLICVINFVFSRCHREVRGDGIPSTQAIDACIKHLTTRGHRRHEDDGGWGAPGRPRASRSVHGRHLGGHVVARGGGWWARRPARADASVLRSMSQASSAASSVVPEHDRGRLTRHSTNFAQLNNSSFHELICPY